MTRYKIEYTALKLALGFFGLLPPDAASWMGGAIFRSVGPFMGISKVARKNIALCFPEWDRARIDTTVKAMWENLGRVVAEYPHLEAIAKSGRVYFKNPEAFHDLEGPVIFVSGHIGNWEVLPPALLFRQGVVMHSVYRAPNNPMVDRLLVDLRGFGGILRSFGKNRKGLGETLRALQEKACVGMLIDQKMNTGIEADFFGHPAMTSTAFVELAKKLGCPVIPGRIIRTGGCRFEIEILQPLIIENRETPDIVRDMHVRLEEWIREYPSQWLWLHRRWKP